MKKLIFVSLLFAAVSAFGQGSSVAWYLGTGCQAPDPNYKILCLNDDKSITVSIKGGAYGPPPGAGTVTVSVDPITITGAPGTAASVINAGDSQHLIARFTIPAGKDGKDGIGTPGAAATIAVGTVTQLPAGSQPTVQNSGTQQAAVLNFGIPIGQPGANGTMTNCPAFKLNAVNADGTWNVSFGAGCK